MIQNNIMDYLDIISKKEIRHNIISYERQMEILSDIAEGITEDKIWDFKSAQYVCNSTTISRTQAIQLLMKTQGKLAERHIIELDKLFSQPKPVTLDLSDLPTQKLVPPVDVEFEEVFDDE